jgi:hypothetical protein
MRKPLWPIGQSPWLQIQRSGFYSRRYHIFWGIVGLEQGSLSLVGTIDELLERKCRGSSLECREYGRRDPSCWPFGTHYPQKLALTSQTSGGRSVCTVRSWTQITEFSLFQFIWENKGWKPCRWGSDMFRTQSGCVVGQFHELKTLTSSLWGTRKETLPSFATFAAGQLSATFISANLRKARRTRQL